MPSQKSPLKEGLFLNSQRAVTDCEFQTVPHFIPKISHFSSHERVSVDVFSSPIITPCLLCGTCSCAVPTNVDPGELPWSQGLCCCITEFSFQHISSCFKIPLPGDTLMAEGWCVMTLLWLSIQVNHWSLGIFSSCLMPHEDIQR